MKYSQKEQLNEILNRGEKLRQKKERNVMTALSASWAVLFFALAGSITVLGKARAWGSQTDYGAFLLSAETGGYVLVAVVAFVVGVITAVLIHRRR